MLGSLLSAHLIIKDPLQPFGDMVPTNYDDELLLLAHDMANRLLAAFEQSVTQIPYPRVCIVIIVISRAVFLLLSNIVSAGPKNQTGLWEHKMGYVMFKSLNLWSRTKALLYQGLADNYLWGGGEGGGVWWPLWESLEDFQTDSPIHPSFLGMTPHKFYTFWKWPFTQVF